MRISSDRNEAMVDVMEQRLREWAEWIGVNGAAGGFPRKSVLHPSWLPPAPGGMPMAAAHPQPRQREIELHQHVLQLPIRQQNALCVVYLMRRTIAEQAALLNVKGSTVRARGSSTIRTVSALSSRTSPRSGAFLVSMSSASCSTRSAFFTW